MASLLPKKRGGVSGKPRGENARKSTVSVHIKTFPCRQSHGNFPGICPGAHVRGNGVRIPPPFPRSLDYEVTVSQLVNFDQRKALEHGPCGLVSGKMYVFIRARRSVGSGKPGDSGHARKIRFGHALANVATFKTGSVLHVLKNSVSLHDLFLSALSATRQLVGCMPPTV